MVIAKSRKCVPMDGDTLRCRGDGDILIIGAYDAGRIKLNFFSVTRNGGFEFVSIFVVLVFINIVFIDVEIVVGCAVVNVTFFGV